jgi:hypothetical protein
METKLKRESTLRYSTKRKEVRRERKIISDHDIRAGRIIGRCAVASNPAGRGAVADRRLPGPSSSAQEIMLVTAATSPLRDRHRNPEQGTKVSETTSDIS